MRKTILLLGLGLIAGIAVSAWWMRDLRETPPDASVRNVLRAADSDKIASLERRLTGQIETLGREVAELRSDFALLSAESDSSSALLTERSSDGGADDVARTAARNELPLRPNAPERRIEAMMQGGFSLARAQEIERLSEEYRVKAMQAQYDAERRGEPLDNTALDRLFNTDAMLRSELGDFDYERYLEARGRSTMVDVGGVLASSAAEQAGMLSGDQIVTYDGQRVFNIVELRELPLHGEPGQLVFVDVVRDGQPIQLIIPRGPLGIFGSTRTRAIPYVPLEEN